MAFKLKKAEAARRGELARLLEEQANALRAAVEGFNEAMAERWGEVESALEDYNGALDDARVFVEEVRGERQGEYDDKSERWQEGERGEAAAAWLAEWEQADLEDVELEGPEPVEEPDLDHADTLSNLPEEAD